MRGLRGIALRSALTGVLLLAGIGTASGFRLYKVIPTDDETTCGLLTADCGDEVTFARWFELDMPFSVNNDAETDAGSAALSQAEIVDAAKAAYQTWQDVSGATIKFTYAGGTDLRLDPTDHDAGGANTTLWYDPDVDVGCSALDALDSPGYDGFYPLGLTILTVDVASGEIIDADVVLNSAVEWVPEDACDDFDPQSILTHEYGHTIGIGHTYEPGPDGFFMTADDPTMSTGKYFEVCSGLRTLDTDDVAAVECLYPLLPAVLLIDQTGSMGAGSRMADAQEAASGFVDDFAGSPMAVAAFAEAPVEQCDPARPGYELKQDWTEDSTTLKDAITALTPCGTTPLWESICCAITKAEEEAPSNVLIFTDTNENASDGDCGCTTFADVLAAAEDASVTIYVIDLTTYFGASPGLASSLERGEAGPSAVLSDGDSLEMLAEATGGLYRAVNNETQLATARLDIRRNMTRVGKIQQLPPTCHPGPFPLDIVQQYLPGCIGPASPFAGQQITVFGRVSAKRGTFDPAIQYIEDCSGGIQVFGPGLPAANVGDSVRVTGMVGNFSGEIRIANVVDYAIVGPPNPGFARPATNDLFECHAVSCCEMVGSLQRFQGLVAGPVTNFRFALVRTLDSPDPDSLTVRLIPTTGIDPGMIQPGSYYVVTGVVRRGPAGIELTPRSPEDVQRIITVDVQPQDPVGGRPRTMMRMVYPNPFGQFASISYTIPERGHVSLRILDVQGKLVRRLFDGLLPGTTTTARWDGRDDLGRQVRSGVYFVELIGPDRIREARRLILVR